MYARYQLVLVLVTVLLVVVVVVVPGPVPRWWWWWWWCVFNGGGGSCTLACSESGCAHGGAARPHQSARIRSESIERPPAGQSPARSLLPARWIAPPTSGSFCALCTSFLNESRMGPIVPGVHIDRATGAETTKGVKFKIILKARNFKNRGSDVGKLAPPTFC